MDYLFILIIVGLEVLFVHSCYRLFKFIVDERRKKNEKEN